MDRKVILTILLIAVFIIILSFFASFEIPPKSTTIQEESGEDDLIIESETIETSPISIFVRIASMVGLIILFFIIIFLLKIKFHLKRFLEFAWILASPFFFINMYMEHLFEKLPCPEHHELEIPMIMAIFLFVFVYIIILTVIIVETVILFIKSTKEEKNEK